MSDRGGTNYTNWVGVQECNDLLKVYLAITHENTTVPYGERGLYHVLPPFKFTLSLTSRNFPQTLLSELITSPLCPRATLSTSLRALGSQDIGFLCVPLHINRNYTGCSLTAEILSYSSLCSQHNVSLKNTLELYAWKDQKEQGLG